MKPILPKSILAELARDRRPDAPIWPERAPEPGETSAYAGQCAGDVRRSAFAAAGKVGAEKDREAGHADKAPGLVERWRDRPAQVARRAAKVAKVKLAAGGGKPGRPRSDRPDAGRPRAAAMVTVSTRPPWVAHTTGGRARVARRPS